MKPFSRCRACLRESRSVVANPPRTLVRVLAAVSCGAVLLVPALLRAAGPPPATLPSAAHIDLARHAWPTGEAERGARGVLDATLDSLTRACAPAPATGAGWLQALELAGRARRLAERHGDYLHVRAAMDNRDLESARAEEAIYASLGKAEERLRGVLVGLDSTALERRFAEEPRLAPWRDFIREQRRLGARPLAPAAAELGTLATSWQFPLYQRIVGETDFGSVPGPAGPLDVRRQRIAIAASPDSTVRETGFQMLAAGYARHRELYAFTLLQTVEAQNALARAQGYRDRPAQAYDARQLGTSEVRTLIAAVRARGAVYRRYEDGLARARTVLEGKPQPRLTRAQLAAAMRAALAPLGPVYAQDLARLYDPASGLLELGPGEHRYAGGFSFGLPDGSHGVYLDDFAGYPADVGRLAHESGHALHFLSFERSGAPAVCEPAFPEVVAQFGEFLVCDHLARTAASAVDRLAWRQQSVRKLLEVFLGAKDAELEQAIYDGAAAGTLHSADDLDRLTARVDSAYTTDHRPVMAGRWMRVSLLVEDPLYLSNYLYSGLIMAALVERLERDPAAFAPRYADFMRQTSAAPPHDMLRRTVGISLDDPTLLEDTLTLLEARVAAFEAEVRAAGRGD
jgi:oligoendopeptidase F